jgi:hypothetical protein
MAFSYYDRVKETSATTGLGAITLGGAVSQFQAFGSVFSNGDTMDYCIADQNGTNWEVGIGTYNSGGNTLSRTAVLASSNAGAAVNFSSGALFVFNVFCASKCITSSIALGSAVSLSNNTGANVTSISLPAGDWDVSGTVGFTAGALTTATAFSGGISQSTGALPTGPGGLAQFGISLSAGGVDPIFDVGTLQVTLTATTTIYLVAKCTFSTSTMAAYGYIQARRR